jgi:SAM-dependent methyltransferase
MDDPKVLERMRADWNRRAGEDAYYYVAFGRREQADEEFFASGAGMVRSLEAELKRLPGRGAALEIGCGPGRLMRPMSRHFGQIHGVDVSDEMVRLAGQRLRATPNAHAHHSSGSDLALFPSGHFDFVYSYAVFQHIPSREVVLNYLREARRVLKTGGILRCQINGLPATARQYDTWSGVRISAEEIARFARDNHWQLLALEQARTQYMWITCRKQPEGWARNLSPGRAPIRNIGNALTGETVAPASGVMAAISLWMENLPADCDLNHLRITAEGAPCAVTYIGEPEADGVSQVNAALPPGIRTGLVPIEVNWAGRPLCAPGWVRVIPAPPTVPRITAITDGVNLLSGTRILTGSVKVTMVQVAHPEQFAARVDGREVLELESFCTDPAMLRYEYNFRLPQDVPAGPHHIAIAMGRRAFAPLAIEVA